MAAATFAGMERTRFERLALWGSVAVLVGSLLPWGQDDGTVWGFQTAGVLTFMLGLVAFWWALTWRSPVVVGVALAGVLAVWAVALLVVAGVYESIEATVFVVPIGAAVGLRGAVGQAPAR